MVCKTFGLDSLARSASGSTSVTNVQETPRSNMPEEKVGEMKKGNDVTPKSAVAVGVVSRWVIDLDFYGRRFYSCVDIFL